MVISDLVKEKQRINGLNIVTDSERNEIQEYYDLGHSLRECQTKFGRCRSTLIRYIKTRSRTKLHENQKRKRNSDGVVAWRKRSKEKLVAYKGSKCQICGYDKYIGNLIFHHKNPLEKDFAISGKTISFDKMLEEVKKCDLLCHNCHGELHAGLVSIPE